MEALEGVFCGKCGVLDGTSDGACPVPSSDLTLFLLFVGPSAEAPRFAGDGKGFWGDSGSLLTGMLFASCFTSFARVLVDARLRVTLVVAKEDAVLLDFDIGARGLRERGREGG